MPSRVPLRVSSADPAARPAPRPTLPRPAPLRSTPLRSGRVDDLGVRRALSDLLLPFLVAAMAFLAALALAGASAADGLAQRWRGDGGAVLTVQVPDPGAPSDPASRVARATALLRADPAVAAVRALGEGELRDLLRPWLGDGAAGIALPLPAVLDVRMRAADADLTKLTAGLESAAPGAQLDAHGPWLRQLGALARSLQACAALAAAVVAGVATAVVAVATRAGISARRDAIAVVHDLGATDGYIAGRFARRATALAGAGALLGTVAALPVLAGLSRLAAPFLITAGPGTLPPMLWLQLALLPLAAAGLGWAVAQGAVRRWLRRLP